CGVSWCRVCWGRVSWLVGWCGVLDDGVETVVVVSGVFDGTDGSVGFDEAVGSFNVTVSVAVFGLAVHVVGVWVVYAVFEVVGCWCVCGLWGVGLWC
ncbi:Uncharacterized protein FWK35_00033259, partial [Aphis craccivora]